MSRDFFRLILFPQFSYNGLSFSKKPGFLPTGITAVLMPGSIWDKRPFAAWVKAKKELHSYSQSLLRNASDALLFIKSDPFPLRSWPGWSLLNLSLFILKFLNEEKSHALQSLSSILTGLPY
jgi:hypothetical protein